MARPDLLLAKHLSCANLPAARRAPYVDYIVVLDDAGKMVEQGTFEEVNSRHGYISGLALDQANWGRDDKVNAVLDAVSSPESVEVLLPKHETPADSARQMGDSAVYKYYIKSAGGVAIVIFIISMAVFAFCDSFPSKSTSSSLRSHAKKELYRSMAQMVGRG